jgi:acyl transferase domain-containing protein
MELAAVNAPGLCVVSGPAPAAAAFAAELEARGVAVRRLHTSHAFHSAVMDALAEPFGAALRRIRLNPPRLPYLSNLTGTWIEPAQATDPAYWLAHLRQPVRFAAALQELAADPARVLLEVGPGRTLATLVHRQEAAVAALTAVSSLPRSGDDGGDEEAVLTALGRLWLAGVEIAWDGFAVHERRRKLPLPSYPFERRRYWLAAAPASSSAAQAGAPAPRPASRQPREDWFWTPIWRQSAVPRRGRDAATGSSRAERAGLGAATGATTGDVGGAAVGAREGGKAEVKFQDAAAGASSAGGAAGGAGAAVVADGAVDAGAETSAPAVVRRAWLLFDDGLGLIDNLASRLRRAGQGVATVTAGGEFAAVSGGRYTLDPGRRGDYVRLFSDLAAAGALPERIVHAWSVTRETAHSGAEVLQRPAAPAARAVLVEPEVPAAAPTAPGAPAADGRPSGGRVQGGVARAASDGVAAGGYSVPGGAEGGAGGGVGGGAVGDPATLTRGFTSLILLAQAMAEVAGEAGNTAKTAGASGAAGEAAAAPPRVELTAVANGLWSVTGDEPIHPEKATLLGPVRVIPLEYGVLCRAIDVVLPASAPALDGLAGELLAELDGAESASPPLPTPAQATAPAQVIAPAQATAPALDEAPSQALVPVQAIAPAPATAPAQTIALTQAMALAPVMPPSVPARAPFEPAVALRAGRRWVQRFDRLPAPASPPAGAGGRLRHGGVVMVTGGLGGIGFTLARHLFETAAARLVLLTHTPLPPRQEWEAAPAGGGVSGGVSDAVRRRIERIRELEGLGAEVLVVEADVADVAAMAAAVEQARARFGAVHGVIHAAGVPSGRLIRHATAAQAAAVLAPKVHGAMVLEKLLPAASLDLCVHCSSLAAILGGVGQVDYCAANAFLDAQAAAAAAGGARGALAIAWDAWREVGMRAGEAGAPPGAVREPQLGLLPAEGLWAFDRAVASGLPEVAVSTLDLRRLIAEMRAAPAAQEMAPAGAPSGGGRAAGMGAGPAHPRPQLATPYAAPRNETEAALASIWEEVLGIGPIGIHDDFNELGGHSLLALQVLSRVRAVLAADLPLRAVFDAPNIAALSLKVLEGAAAAADEAALEQMLAGLEGLSDAEAEALLGGEQVPQAADGKAPGEPR